MNEDNKLENVTPADCQSGFLLFSFFTVAAINEGRASLPCDRLRNYNPSEISRQLEGNALPGLLPLMTLSGERPERETRRYSDNPGCLDILYGYNDYGVVVSNY